MSEEKQKKSSSNAVIVAVISGIFAVIVAIVGIIPALREISDIEITQTAVALQQTQTVVAKPPTDISPSNTSEVVPTNTPNELPPTWTNTPTPPTDVPIDTLTTLTQTLETFEEPPIGTVNFASDLQSTNLSIGLQNILIEAFVGDCTAYIRCWTSASGNTEYPKPRYQSFSLQGESLIITAMVNENAYLNQTEMWRVGQNVAGIWISPPGEQNIEGLIPPASPSNTTHIGIVRDSEGNSVFIFVVSTQ